jgi:hypothetical protein
MKDVAHSGHASKIIQQPSPDLTEQVDCWIQA